MILNPLVGRASLARIVRPTGGDEANLALRIEGDSAQLVEDVRVNGVVDDYRIDRLVAHFNDALVGPGRLQNRGRCKCGIEVEALLILIPIESPNEIDWPIYTMHDIRLMPTAEL